MVLKMSMWLTNKTNKIRPFQYRLNNVAYVVGSIEWIFKRKIVYMALV